MKDELFRKPLVKVTDFEFDDQVAQVFDDMLNRSIPFYAEIQAMIKDWVSSFYIPGTTVCDLGCSTGSLLAHLGQACPEIRHLLGIDNSAAMIAKARERFDELQLEPKITLHEGDLREYPLPKSSIIIMNYTLQFIRPLFRHQVVRQIFDALEPGGAFILSEKVLEDSTHLSRLFLEAYYRFKRNQGYSDLEISQKRERLENVLVPYKISEHRTLLAECGFEHVEIFFKWHNFTSFIAIKKYE